MITPTFKVDQDESFVIVTIHTPHVRAQDVDLHADGNEFRFYLKPYFLRLYFPGSIVEDDASEAVYDPSSGEFVVKLSKGTKGEHFPDLDLLTKLLARKGEQDASKAPKKPLIEVVSSEDYEGKDEMQEAVDFNWELPQELPEDTINLGMAVYGFNSLHTGYLRHVNETANEINELDNPETSTPKSRRQERLQKEDQKFDEDHYAKDFAEDEDIRRVLDYKTVWYKELKRITKKSDKKPLIQEINAVDEIDFASLTISNDSLIRFTDKDKAMMRDLPKREYLLSSEKATYLGLLDLMFAYSYNHRIFEGENSVESVWCIGKLSSSMACLDQFMTMREALLASYRRALAYPLYRHWDLCQKVMNDVYILFKLGKRAILKALLEMKDMFDHHDVYYIYSKIWLDDYCTWIQQSSDHVIRTLARELHYFQLQKKDVNFDLELLEQIVTSVLEDEKEEAKNNPEDSEEDSEEESEGESE